MRGTRATGHKRREQEAGYCYLNGQRAQNTAGGHPVNCKAHDTPQWKGYVDRQSRNHCDWGESRAYQAGKDDTSESSKSRAGCAKLAKQVRIRRQCNTIAFIENVWRDKNKL